MIASDFYVFFFNDTATTEIYTLSLHDALPIWRRAGRPRRSTRSCASWHRQAIDESRREENFRAQASGRSEEHTSELQSRQYLVCRLLLEKKKNKSQLVNKITSTTTSAN